MLTRSKKRQGQETVAIPRETVQMLGVVLKSAFRMHCTGETICGKSAWQVIGEVERRLADLSEGDAALVSEDRIAQYVENELPARRLKLAQVA